MYRGFGFVFSELGSDSYIDKTLREMCPIVNHVWTSFVKTIYFLRGSIMDKYMFSYHLKKIRPNFHIIVIIML
jgi:hypothetical protein